MKTGIFYEFSKSGLSATRPGERKTGTSDVKPGHYQQRRQQKREGGVFEKKKALIQSALVQSIDISQVMASNEFSLDSSSEIEDYEIEVEGLPNSSDHADEYYADEETQEWVCLVGKTETPISSLFSLQFRNYRTPVAQLVEHRVIMREVVSSTPTGPTLRVLK